jgi:polyhydroxybutyrate depolymerase
MKKIFFSLIFASFSSFVLGQESYRTLESDSLHVGDLTRSFLFHKSPNLASKTKLIFVLHGSGGSGKLIHQFTDAWFSKLADERGNVIVVYPNGYKKHWNECRKEANFEANLLNIDDNSFFIAMINYFTKNYGIDKKKVFVTGHSNGGQEVFKLAKEMPQYFKKYAAVSANLPVASNDDCLESGKAVSMMVINGTGDGVNPYEGGTVKLSGGALRGDVISTDQTFAYWANLAKLDYSKALKINYADTNKEDGATASLIKIRNKKYDIRLIKVENGGHILAVPQALKPPASLGKYIQDINMAKEIVDYFFEK